MKVSDDLALISIDRLRRYIREHLTYDKFEEQLNEMENKVKYERKTQHIITINRHPYLRRKYKDLEPPDINL